MDRLSIVCLFWFGVRLTTVTMAQDRGNASLVLNPLDNSHLGSQFELLCDYTYAGLHETSSRAHFYRKRPTEPNFAEIGRVIEIGNTPEYLWNDTKLQTRASLQMISRSQIRLTVNNLECSDQADYRCMFYIGTQKVDYERYSDERTFTATAKPRIPQITYSPSVITENEEVQFTCSGNVGKPAGSLQILLVTSSGQQVDLNANNELAVVEMNGCTCERRATANHEFTSADNGRSRVMCRVQQTYADNTHVNQTSLSVQYTPRSTVMYKSVDGETNVRVNPGDVVKVPVESDVLLTCETNSNPASKYEWSYTLEGSNNTMTDNTDSVQLRLKQVTLQHSVDYKCTATNQIKDITYSDTVTLKLDVSRVIQTSTELTSTDRHGMPTPPAVLPTDSGVTEKPGGSQQEPATEASAIVGGVVGGVLAVLITISAGIFVYRRRFAQNSSEKTVIATDHVLDHHMETPASSQSKDGDTHTYYNILNVTTSDTNRSNDYSVTPAKGSEYEEVVSYYNTTQIPEVGPCDNVYEESSKPQRTVYEHLQLTEKTSDNPDNMYDSLTK